MHFFNRSYHFFCFFLGRFCNFFANVCKSAKYEMLKIIQFWENANNCSKFAVFGKKILPLCSQTYKDIIANRKNS